MPTHSRYIQDGTFYHLYNRGNHKEPIFHNAQDYERFLWTFTDAAAEHNVGIHAYCLMPNHYHALVRQRNGGSISTMLRSATVSYVKYYNKSYGQVGHLFQGKYQFRPIRDVIDLAHITRYIHCNPVNLASIDSYEWSSFSAYVGQQSRFCDPKPVLRRIAPHNPEGYATFCRSVKNSDLKGGY